MITRDFMFMTERYFFDNGKCKTSNGYAQIDTHNDASYFGIWGNPFTFTIISFLEGDVITEQLESADEFVQAILEHKECYKHGFLGIDPGFNDGLKQEFINIGLKELLH